MVDDFAHLFQFNRWANQRSFEACRKISTDDYTRPFPGELMSIHATVVHIAAATLAWTKRIEGISVASLPKPEEVPTLDDAIKPAEEAQVFFEKLVGEIQTEKLNEILSFRNLANEPKSAPLWTILRHVVNHASYHRGQIASKLKAYNVVAPPTDFIAWVYEQHV